jgi:acyl-CoA thioester hydrolase
MASSQNQGPGDSELDDHGEQAGSTGDVFLAGEIRDGVHHLAARVYFADTDFSGVVYHARYLEFLERGRSDFLRLAGVHHTELAGGLHGEALIWVVRRMEIDFKASARIDNVLLIETRVDEISGARVFMAQGINCGDRKLVTARVEAAVIGTDGRPRRFPKDWIGRFMPG